MNKILDKTLWGISQLILIIILVLILNLNSNSKLPQVQSPQTPKPQLQNLNYPLSQEVTTYIGKRIFEESFVNPDIADKLISVVHKVVYNETTKQFNYTYKLSYVGKEKCFLNWQLLDKINNTQLCLIELEPAKTYEFSMDSPNPPAITEGSVWLYKKKGNFWELVLLPPQIGPLPKSEN